MEMLQTEQTTEEKEDEQALQFDEIVENEHEDTQQKFDYDIDIGQSAKKILKVSFQIVDPESSSIIENVDNSGDESLVEKSEVVTLGKR